MLDMQRGAPSLARALARGLAVLALLQIAVGFVLNHGYSPTLAKAHSTVEAARHAPFLAILQGFHYWGSAALIVLGGVLIFGLVFTGGYLRLSRGTWLGTLALVGSSLAMQITGNLLPMDRHDVQTLVVEAGISSRLPLVGPTVVTAMLGENGFGEATLARWHTAHILLLLPLLLGCWACLRGYEDRERSRRTLTWILPSLGVLALAFLVTPPYGPAAEVADFASFDARPSWYAWPMHGALRAAERIAVGWGWVGSALLPGALGLLLVAAPWAGRKRDRLVRYAALGLGLTFAFAGPIFGGRPAAAWGLQDTAEAGVSGANEPIDESLAAQGREIALKQCSPCHGKNLRGGASAPNLTTMYTRGRSQNWYERFLKDPANIRQGSTMPSMVHLGDDQIAKLAQYLRQPKAERP